MNSREKQPSLKITAMSVADVARVLSAALNRRIIEDQVREVAEAGDLLREGIEGNDTINLVQYTAWLAKDVTHAPAPGTAPGIPGTPEND